MMSALHILFRRLLHYTFVQLKGNSTTFTSVKKYVLYGTPPCCCPLSRCLSPLIFFRSCCPALRCRCGKVIKLLDVCVCACRYACTECVFECAKACACLHPAATSAILYFRCHSVRRQLMRACVLICYLATVTVPPVAPGNHCCGL